MNESERVPRKGWRSQVNPDMGATVDVWLRYCIPDPDPGSSPGGEATFPASYGSQGR